jgi:hypothetical protein
MVVLPRHMQTQVSCRAEVSAAVKSVEIS